MMDTTTRARNLVVVGDGACGKTSLLIAFAHDEFPETDIATVSKTYLTEINVDGQKVQFELWDTAGLEDFDRHRRSWYPNTDVIIICFSLNNRDSYDNVYHKWVPEVRHFFPRTPIILVGTKSDLRGLPPGTAGYGTTSGNKKPGYKKPVAASEGSEMGRHIKAHRYVECSAKTRDGIEDVFQSAAKAALCPSRPKHRGRRICVTL